MHNYDQYGWYTSEDNGREADLEPPSTSETTTPGEDRANWTGRRWVVAPYTEPPEPVEPAPEVPVSVTQRQGRIILARYGLLAAVDAYFASDGLEEQQIEFEYAQEWRRDWQTLIDAAHSFGLTDEQIDQMFIEASSL